MQAGYRLKEDVSLDFKRHILEKTAGFASEPMADLYRVQMLGVMLNRYDELLEKGLSAENSCRRVLDEFADLAVKMQEMGFEEADGDEEYARWPQLTEKETELYLRQQDAYQHRIALGVALCTACLCPLMLTSALAELFFGFAGDAASLLGAGGMLGMIAMGVYLFVTAVKPKNDKMIKNGRFSLSNRLRRKLEQMREMTDKRARGRVGKGIAAIVMCIVPVLLGSVIDEMFLWRSGGEGCMMLGTVGMFAMIAAGVYELVMANGEKKTMKRLLNQKE